MLSREGDSKRPILLGGGDNVEPFAAALAAALLTNRFREVFKIEETLSLAAFSGLSRKLRVGDLGAGEYSSSCSAAEARFGFETDMPFLRSDSAISDCFVGDRKTEVDALFVCPRVLVVRSGIAGSRRGDR